MRLGTAVGSTGAHSPTVYTVLAESARSHSRRYLAAEASLAGAAAAVILAWQRPWWPVASRVLAVGLPYAGWGLLARRDSGPERRRRAPLLRLIVAGLATAATLGGLGGLALKAFWGTTPGPYGTCYRPDGKSYACDVDGHDRAVSHPPN